jgi:hypothetical protein
MRLPSGFNPIHTAAILGTRPLTAVGLRKPDPSY